jgi:hypothetical protein
MPLSQRKLKHEIPGEPLPVAANLLVETFGRDTIEGGEVGIKQYPLCAH